MYKSCSRCGKIHDTNYKCNVGVVYKGGQERKLRSTYKWTKKSQEIRDRANYLCEVCKDMGALTYDGLEVHHIKKITGRPDLLLDNLNTVVLCQYHHKEADAGRISEDYLTELARRREGVAGCEK